VEGKVDGRDVDRAFDDVMLIVVFSIGRLL
jgi:hypothetical protein